MIVTGRVKRSRSRLHRALTKDEDGTWMMMEADRLIRLWPFGKGRRHPSMIETPSLPDHVVPQDIWMPEDGRQLTEEDILDLSFPIFASPIVSVIIPTYGKAWLTLQCLKSIVRHPPHVPYEVLVVDDASGEADVELLGRIPGLRLEKNPTNLRFLRSCNRAAELTRGTYLFFLNNDTLVKTGWLDTLLETFARFPNAGIVGSKLLFPNGTLQEAGGIIWNDGSGWNYGRTDDPAKPQYNYVRDADYISGCAIMIPKIIWDELGGFDDFFAPAYCEDSDLAFRVRAHGMKVLYCPFSEVIHLEGVSNGTDLGSGQKAYQVINAQKLLTRWQSVLTREHYPSGEKLLLARDGNRGRNVALILGDLSERATRTSRWRVLRAMVDALLAADYVVKVGGLPRDMGSLDIRELRAFGIEAFYEETLESWLEEHGYAVALAIVSSAKAPVIPMLRAHSPAKIVQIDDAAADGTGSPDKPPHTPDLLIEFGLPRSSTERSQASRKCLPSLVVAECRRDPTPPDAALVAVLCGSGPRARTDKRHMNSVLTALRRNAPSATILFLDAAPTAPDVASPNPDARLLIVANNEDLAADVHIIRALQHGTPILTTESTSESLSVLRDVVTAAKDDRSLVEEATRLIQDDSAWQDAATRQLAFARTYFAPSHTKKAFLDAIHGEVRAKR